jgi:hypothetical protein
MVDCDPRESHGREEWAMRYTADLRVTFVVEDDQPDGHAKRILYREAAQFQHAIENGRWHEKTGVEAGSVKVEILSNGPLS